MHLFFKKAIHLWMIKTVIVILIVWWYLPGFQAEAQNYMILQKGSNQKSRIKYEVGDLLVYQQNGQDFFVKDQIKEIHTDFLVLNENILRPDDIYQIDVRDKDERNHTIGNLSALLISAGALLLTAETINGLYHEGKLIYSTGGLIASGSFLASGLILSRFKYNYFKHQGKNKIQIIYLD